MSRSLQPSMVFKKGNWMPQRLPFQSLFPSNPWGFCTYNHENYHIVGLVDFVSLYPNKLELATLHAADTWHMRCTKVSVCVTWLGLLLVTHNLLFLIDFYFFASLHSPYGVSHGLNIYAHGGPSFRILVF